MPWIHSTCAGSQNKLRSTAQRLNGRLRSTTASGAPHRNEGKDGTESRWGSLAEARPEAREPGTRANSTAVRTHPHPFLEVTSAEPFRKTSAVIQVWFEGDAAALAWVAVKASLRKPFVKWMTARNRDGDPLPMPDPRRASRPILPAPLVQAGLVQAGFDNSGADYVCCSGRHGNRGRQPPLCDTWNWTPHAPPTHSR